MRRPTLCLAANIHGCHRVNQLLADGKHATTSPLLDGLASLPDMLHRVGGLGRKVLRKLCQYWIAAQLVSFALDWSSHGHEGLRNLVEVVFALMLVKVGLWLAASLGSRPVYAFLSVLELVSAGAKHLEAQIDGMQGQALALFQIRVLSLSMPLGSWRLPCLHPVVGLVLSSIQGELGLLANALGVVGGARLVLQGTGSDGA